MCNIEIFSLILELFTFPSHTKSFFGVKSVTSQIIILCQAFIKKKKKNEIFRGYSILAKNNRKK